MSLAGAIRAGAAYVEILADDNPLTRGLNSAKTQIASWGKSVKGLGGRAFGGAFEALGEATGAGGLLGSLGKLAASPAGMFAGFLAAAQQAASSGAALNDLSKNTGISVESLGTLKYAAEQSGDGVEGLEASLHRMQKALAEAARGEEGSTKALQAAGLSVRDFIGLAPDDQFRKMAAAISSIKDPAMRTEAAMGLLGKSGGRSIALLSELPELEARARELGLGSSTAAAEAGESFQRLLTDVKLLGKGILGALGGPIVPILSEYVSMLASGLATVRMWLKEHKGLVTTAFKVSAAIVAVGGSLMVAGLLLGKIAAIAGAVASGFSLIGSAAGMLMTGLSFVAGIPGMLAAGFAALLSPIGLTVLGIVAIGVALGAGLAAWLAWTDSGQQTLASLKAGWDTFKTDMLTMWGGIVDAISAGDLALAWQVLLAGLQLEWARIVNYLKDSWSSIKFVALDAFAGMWAGAREGYLAFTQYMRSVWSELTTWMGNTWSKAQQNAGNLLLTALEKLGVLTAQEAKVARETMSQQLKDDRAKRDAENVAKQAELDKETKAETDRIAKERDADKAAALKGWSEERKAQEDDLAAKKKALDELRAKAKEAADKSATEKAAASGKAGGGFNPGGITGPTVAVGSFSGAVGGILAGGPLDRLVVVGEQALAVQERNEVLLAKIAKDAIL